jgi:predicted dehydrogenase
MDKERVGVIGVGAFGEGHVAATSSLPYVTVAAVCSRHAARVEENAARQHDPPD